MKHSRLLALALLLFTFALTPLAAGGAGTFYGFFLGKAFDGKTAMEWQFLRGKNGEVTVTAIIFQEKGKGKVSLGRGPGKNVKVVGNKLEFEIDWFQSQKIKGPKDAKYVAEIKGLDLAVNWTAGDEKGELTATNRDPKALAKKDDKADDKKKAVGGAPEKVYLSGLTDDKLVPIQKGIITNIALVIPMGKASKGQYLKVTKDTKFIVVDGDDSKTYDQKNVLDDPAVRAAFRERYVTLERQGNIAVTVTATVVKKK